MVPASDTVKVTPAAAKKYPLLVDFLSKASTATLRSDNMQSTMYSNLLDVVSQELPKLYSGELDAKAFCQKLTDAAAKNK
jgi:raffinose/stachyose/melibiose transport system substrate-binding protein